MKLGLRLPQGAGVNLRTDIVDVARKAEALGYSSLWVFERLLAPVHPKESYPGPGHEAGWPPAQRELADALAVLTAAAVVTEHVRLGTLEEVVEDVVRATELGADEVSIDLNLQTDTADTSRLLDTAAEIHDLAVRPGSARTTGSPG